MTPSGRPDEELIAALAQRDLNALEELYDRYNQIAYSLAYRIVGDRGIAEDVTQEAFLSVWRQAAKDHREKASARTWLMSIVHHRSIDRLNMRLPPRARAEYDEIPATY